LKRFKAVAKGEEFIDVQLLFLSQVRLVAGSFSAQNLLTDDAIHYLSLRHDKMKNVAIDPSNAQLC